MIDNHIVKLKNKKSMAKKNFKDEEPKKSLQDWAKEQLDSGLVEAFLDVCDWGEEGDHKPTDEISLDEFLGLKEKYGFNI